MAATAFSLVPRPQTKGLLAVLECARKSLTLVTPFVTEGGIAAVREGTRDRRVDDIHLLTSLTAESIWSGACDPTAIRKLLEDRPSASVRSLPGLHAKVYVADDKLALVTSANLTTPGLHTNYEYGVLLSDRHMVRGILADLAAYSRVGTLLGTGELLGLCALADETRKRRRRAEGRALRKLQEDLEAILLPAQVGERTETSLFADAVYYVLRTHGPLTTPQIGENVRALHPELCDDHRERIINGRRFGKRWKHILRSAQQYLLRHALITREGRLWRIAEANRTSGPPLSWTSG